MKARILADEPIYAGRIGAKLMKKVTIKLWDETGGWSKAVTFDLPAEFEVRPDIDDAVREILRDEGKDGNFEWA